MELIKCVCEAQRWEIHKANVEKIVKDIMVVKDYISGLKPSLVCIIGILPLNIEDCLAFFSTLVKV